MDPNFPAMILRNTLVLVFALTVGFPALSQGIYGLKQNVLDPFTEGLLLARFDMELGAWAEYDTLGFAEAFALGSSTFDNVSGQYVFVGASLGGGPLEWYNYDVEGNALSAGAELADYVHSLHHDMQHNRFFGLQGYAADSVYIDLGEVDGEPFGYWQVDGWATRLVEVAPFTAEIDPLIDLPDVESVIAGASCLDSDSGAYYFLAFGGNGITRLVQLDAEAGTVTSDVEVVLGPDEAFAEIEFCIPTGQVVGLWRDLSEAGVMRLATLDAETGEPTEVVALPQVWGFTPDGSVFDQNTNSYVLHYYDTDVQPHLLAVDVVTGEIWADHDLEGSSFLELECNNRAFATARYGLPQGTSFMDDELGLAWREGCLVHIGREPVEWILMDVRGRRVDSGRLAPGATLASAAMAGILLWREGPSSGAVQLKPAY